MTMSVSNIKTVLVIGAGTMGIGIAQIVAQSGQTVLLYDANTEAPGKAKQQLTATFEKLVGKGKITAESAEQALVLIAPISTLDKAADADLVIEAIVENLEIKRSVFQQLESIVSSNCILATNTSSISVTAIANGLQHPQRLVGMHFFNPVPLMKLVEVISGLQTEQAVASCIYDLSLAWGKVPVYAKPTPGFIVNRIARPYYAETLALLQEQAARPVVLDACMRAVGFRMGPCELMDLIGHDANFLVSSSVYKANFYDKRFVPSLVQQELVDGGLLGRKTGQGFYRYGEGVKNPVLPEYVKPQAFEINDVGLFGRVTLLGRGRVAERLAIRLTGASISFSHEVQSNEEVDRLVGASQVANVGLRFNDFELLLTDGRTASQRGTNIVVFDRPVSNKQGADLAYAVPGSLADDASDALAEKAAHCLRVLGFNPHRLSDVPGLVVSRTLAMLINEAADAIHQGVCTQDGADAAMKMGVNYPQGPFEWLAAWDVNSMNTLLDNLDAWYRGERYRVSPWLRQRALQEKRAI